MGVPNVRSGYCTCEQLVGHSRECPITTGLWPALAPTGAEPTTIALALEIERLRNLARLVAVQLEALADIDGVAAYEAVRDRLLVEMQSSPIEGVA